MWAEIESYTPVVAPGRRFRGHRIGRKVAMLAGALGLVAGGYFVARHFAGPDEPIPMATARRGGFLRALQVNGQVQAGQASILVAPRVRNLRITWIAPEGSSVAAGDPVVRFDATQQEADLQTQRATLKIAATALERAQKELLLQEKQLSLAIEEASRLYDEQKYEAERIAREAKLRLEVAELNRTVRLDQLRADVDKANIEVQRARDQVALGERELAQMTLTAPIAGMVVLLDTWKGTTATKVQAGDSPYQGQPLVTLPDLSGMILETTVAEVDANAVNPGQEAWVTVDAFPDHMYQAEVTRKGTLGRRKEPNAKINVFDVELRFLEPDPRLRPGMMASARINIDMVPLAVTVPLEAVFERQGQPVVYLADGKPRSVQVGRRNDVEIEVVAGLRGDERVCLVDPTGATPDRHGSLADPTPNQAGFFQLPAEAHTVSVQHAITAPVSAGLRATAQRAGTLAVAPAAASQPTPSQPAPVQPRVPLGLAYTVQVLASSRLAVAESVRTALRSRFDLQVVVDLELPYYKVRVGGCNSRLECRPLVEQMRAAGFPEAFVVATRQKREP